MTEINDGQTVDARLPGGVAIIDAGPPVMGPPGLRGPRGERGDPGGTTTIVFSFANRSPDELPESGLIPAGWDDVRTPESPIQVGVGQSVEYRGDGYLWTFLGPTAIPGGWIESGQMRGPPGDRGPIGDTGPRGERGERGEQGVTGTTGATGAQGPTGPQGARGEIGPTGPPGATGLKGDQGDRGEIGPGGPQGATGAQGEQGERGERGETGEQGDQGERGDQGEAGAPSFIVWSIFTRTGSELASNAPTGLIPANFDGAGRPAAPVQLVAGQAVMAQMSSDPLVGQAIVYLGDAVSSQAWIAMEVKGPRGDKGEQGEQGATGAQGPAGATGAAGLDGARWHWSPANPPDDMMLGPTSVGDWALVLQPGGQPTTPGYGDVYQKQPGAVGWQRQGSILGPAGAQGPPGPTGPPGEVSAAELAALTARVAAIESRMLLRMFELTADRDCADGADTVLGTQVLPQGAHTVVAQLACELRGPSTSPRVITAWVVADGAAAIDGPRSAQLTLHQALSIGSLTLGPARLTVTGTSANATLHVRVDPAPQGGNPTASPAVRVLRSTSLGDWSTSPPNPIPDAKAGATGLVASGT